MATTTRERLVRTGAHLFRHQGFAATGVKQVVAEAQAPFSSLYHFFPGGKQELAEEALRGGGDHFLGLYLAVAADAPDVASAVSRFFAGAQHTLETTGFADACPVATVAGEVADTNERLREVCAEVFSSWVSALVEDLVAAGLPEATARPLALTVLSLLEGAFLLSRTLRDTGAMEAAGQAACVLVDTALASNPRR